MPTKKESREIVRSSSSSSSSKITSTNIKESANAYLFSDEVPGLEKGDIAITIKKGVLEIKGKSNERTEEREGNRIRSEYHSSRYYRRFTIPENVNESAIDAKIENGTLKVLMPKGMATESKKKRIEIK